MSSNFDKLVKNVKKGAKGASAAASTAADKAGKAVAQAADSARKTANENIPGFEKGTEAVGNAAGSAFEAAQGAAATAKQKVDEAVDNGADEYEAAIVAYNTAYTDMSDRGSLLFRHRERAFDVTKFAESLVNSIANKPKSFDAALEEITIERKEFTAAEEYALEEIKTARASVGTGGAGLMAGVAVAELAPSAAMWIATTFGTASTGTAISALSGAAATNAALAWLGGGTLAAGGAGAAGGSALLALAGPVGWSIAGATLLTSLALFTKKRIQTREARNKDLLAVKANTEKVREVDAKIGALLDQTISMRDALDESFVKSMRLAASDYATLSDEDKMTLGALVNNAKTLASLLNTKIADPVVEEEVTELAGAEE